MNCSFYLIFFLMMLLPHASANIRISEFLASNTSGILDEDGDPSDWLEIHNDGAVTVDLAGWHLTDDDTDLKKWTFPSVSLPAGGYLLVWASGKDRRVVGRDLHTSFRLKKSGEYLALVQSDGSTVVHAFAPAYPVQVSDISYGLSAGAVTTTVLQQGSLGQAGVPSSEFDFIINFSGWNTNVTGSYSLGNWRTIQSGVGYDTGSTYGSWIGFNGDFRSELQNVTGSLFFRQKFTIDNPSEVTGLNLRMRWDDGMLVYINGVKVASNSAPAIPEWNSMATVNRVEALNDDWTTFQIDLSQGTLNEGENLLAIQGMNITLQSSDFLILPELDVISPAESSQSLYFTTPTPNAANQAGTTALAPLVEDVTDVLAVLPAGSTGSMPIYVDARVTKTMYDVASVRLYYRRMFDAESSLLMVDDGTNGDQFSGDGVYTGVIPTTSMSAGQMMRWRVLATDTQGNAMRAPLYGDYNDSDEYYGTIADAPSITTSNLPVLHWFVANYSAANTRGGTRASYYYLGRFYDNIQVDLHGQSTSGFFKKSYDIDFNKGNRFSWKEGEGKVKDINLLTNWADKTKMRNTFAYEMFSNAGAAHHFAFPVRVQQNGVFFSIADMVEDGDDRFLERIGLDGDGALYKMYNKLTGPGSKKTRLYEGTLDIQTLVSSLNEGRSQDARRRYGYDHVDIPETVNYLAGLVLAGSQDQGHKNYYVYRDSNGTGEWMPIVWDVDLSFGHDWGGQGYFDDDFLFNNTLHLGFANRLKTLIWNSPEMNAMFVRRVRTMMDQFLQENSTPLAERYLESRIDTMVELMDPVGVISDADLDFSRWGSWRDGGSSDSSASNKLRPQADRLKLDYLPNRRAFLYSTTPESNGLKIPAAQTSSPSITIEQDLDYNPSSGNQDEEYFILKNRESEAIDISGWTISGAVEMTFKGGTVIPPGAGTSISQYIGLLYVARDASAFRARTSGPTGGAYRFIQGGYDGQLSARGETIELRDTHGNLIDSRSFSGNPTPAQLALRVSEINYHPSDPTEDELLELPRVVGGDFEWIELVNTGATSLDLTGAIFTKGIEFSFLAGTTLGVGQRIVLVKNPEAFALRYGAGIHLVGPYFGQLANGGERLQINDASGENIFDFSWNDQWYPPSDGAGRTLVIRDPSISLNTFDEPESWGISESDLGSPGVSDAMYFVHFEAWRYGKFSKIDRLDPQVGMSDSDPDGDGLTNWAEYCYGLNPHAKDCINIRQLTVNEGAGDYVAIELTRCLNAFDVDWSLRSSDDLTSWSLESSVIYGSPQVIGSALEKVVLKTGTLMDADGKKFFRVQGLKQ